MRTMLVKALFLTTVVTLSLGKPNGYYHQEYNYQTQSSSYKNNELQHQNNDEGFYAKTGDFEGRYKPLVDSHSQHSEYVNPKLQHGYQMGTDRSASYGQLHTQGGAYNMMANNQGLRDVTRRLQTEMEREMQKAVIEQRQRVVSYGGSFTNTQIENDRRLLEEELRRNMTMRLQEALRNQYGSQGVKGGYSYSIIDGRLQPTANYNNQDLTNLRQQMENDLINDLNQEIQTQYHTQTTRNTYGRYDDGYSSGSRHEPIIYHPRPMEPRPMELRPMEPHPIAPIPDSVTTVATRAQTELNEILNKLLEDTQRRYFTRGNYNSGVNYDVILARLQDELKTNITIHLNEQVKRTYGYSSHAYQQDLEDLRRQIENNLMGKLNRDFTRQKERFMDSQVVMHTPTHQVIYSSNQNVNEMQRQLHDEMSRNLQRALIERQNRQSYAYDTQANYQMEKVRLEEELKRNLTRQMERMMHAQQEQYQNGIYESQMAAMRNQLQNDLNRQLQQGLQRSYSHYSSWSSSASSSSAGDGNYRTVRGYDQNAYGGYAGGEDCTQDQLVHHRRIREAEPYYGPQRGYYAQLSQDLTQQVEPFNDDLTQQIQTHDDLTQQTEQLNEDLTQQVQANDDLTQQIQTHDDLTQQVQANDDLIQPVQSHDDLTQQVQPVAQLIQQVQTHDDLAEQVQTLADLTQQVQTQYELTQQEQTHDDLTQQVQTHDDLIQQVQTHDDLIQQEQTHDDLTQKVQTHDDLIQQEQTHDDLTQQVQTHDDLIQQVQTHDDLIQQVPTHDDLTQQVQTHDDLTQQVQTHDDLTQQEQTHDDLTQQIQTHDDLTQQVQTNDDLTQQVQTHDDLSQQIQTHDDLTQQIQTHDDLTQQVQTHNDLTQQEQTHDDLTQQVQTHNDLTQQVQTHDDLTQQVQTHDDLTQQAQTHDDLTQQVHTHDDLTQQVQSQDELHNQNQQSVDVEPPIHVQHINQLGNQQVLSSFGSNENAYMFHGPNPNIYRNYDYDRLDRYRDLEYWRPTTKKPQSQNVGQRIEYFENLQNQRSTSYQRPTNHNQIGKHSNDERLEIQPNIQQNLVKPKTTHYNPTYNQQESTAHQSEDLQSQKLEVHNQIQQESDTQQNIDEPETTFHQNPIYHQQEPTVEQNDEFTPLTINNQPSENLNQQRQNQEDDILNQQVAISRPKQNEDDLLKAQQQSQKLIELLRTQSRRQKLKIGEMDYSPRPVYSNYEGQQIQVGTTRQIADVSQGLDDSQRQEPLLNQPRPSYGSYGGQKQQTVEVSQHSDYSQRPEPLLNQQINYSPRPVYGHYNGQQVQVGTTRQITRNQQDYQQNVEVAQHSDDSQRPEPLLNQQINYSPRPVYGNYNGQQVQVGTTRQISRNQQSYNQNVEVAQHSDDSQHPEPLLNLKPGYGSDNQLHSDDSQRQEPLLNQQQANVEEVEAFTGRIEEVESVEPQVAHEVQSVTPSSTTTTMEPGRWQRFKQYVKNKVG